MFLAAETRQRRLLRDVAHDLEAAHHAAHVVRIVEEIRIDARCLKRIAAGQRHAAATLRAQQADMGRVAVTEDGLPAVVDQLANDEVKLQVGDGFG